MKFFTSIVVLAMSVANAMETEDCCEVPSGSLCPVGGYPVTTAGGKLRKLAASDDTTCCKTEGIASEFNLGTDPIPTCAALAASDVNVNVLNEDDQGEDETNENQDETTVGSSGTSSCCKTTEATCPEGAPMSDGTKMSYEICCTTDNPGTYIFDWLVVCGKEGSVQVMDVNGEGDDQGEDEDETTTTTTTSGADATDCCTTTDSTCPSGKTNVGKYLVCIIHMYIRQLNMYDSCVC